MIPTECGVSECDYEASKMRRPWPTKGCCAMGKSRMLKGNDILLHIILRSVT